MTTTVSLSFAALTIDCADPAALADFWGKALGRPVSPGAVAGDTAVDTAGPDSGPRMILHNPAGPGTARSPSSPSSGTAPCSATGPSRRWPPPRSTIDPPHSTARRLDRRRSPLVPSIERGRPRIKPIGRKQS